jgi:tRNA wybutosine-synthesizing protein 2
MFASGNGTERKRMASINAKGEVIVDMFAGIGYFSVPLAKRSGAKAVFSIEKNPASFLFLKNNASNASFALFYYLIFFFCKEINKIDTILHPFCGDNRSVSPVRDANRVLMGYIPTPVVFFLLPILFFIN